MFNPKRTSDSSGIHDQFYLGTLKTLIEKGHISIDMTILVVCGGMRDRDTFLASGFERVTISSLDDRMSGNDFLPYQWSYQDVEELQYPDHSFDFVVVHHGLHHCMSPHRGLLEMYRVARRGVLAFEPRNSMLVRLGVKLGIGQEYEVAAMYSNDPSYGGVKNSEIPNFVYRWNEEEVYQTVHSFAPFARHQIEYVYGMNIPWGRLQALKSKTRLLAVRLGLPLLRLFIGIAPRQSNGFAFLILKPDLSKNLHPWLAMEDGRVTVRRDWVNARYV